MSKEIERFLDWLLEKELQKHYEEIEAEYIDLILKASEDVEDLTDEEIAKGIEKTYTRIAAYRKSQG